MEFISQSNVALEEITVKVNEWNIRQEIDELMSADVSVVIDGSRYVPGKRETLIREGSNYMKEFVKNENGELIEVDYYSY